MLFHRQIIQIEWEKEGPPGNTKSGSPGLCRLWPQVGSEAAYWRLEPKVLWVGVVGSVQVFRNWDFAPNVPF